MYKLWIAIYKEFLLISRDIGGFVILFLMPLVLVITVTLIQDSSFKKINEAKIPVIVIDNDNAEVSKSIITNLKENNIFEIVNQYNDKLIDENLASNLVLKGKFQLAIIIPKELSENLNQKVNQNVSKILDQFGIEDEIVEDDKSIFKPIKQQEIKLIFDPTTQLTFKSSVKNTIDKMVSKIETVSIYKAFQDELETEEPLFNNDSFIKFNEIYPKTKGSEIRPNSVQHNVPAWSLFAIFFIILPLSINIVKEKSQGTYVRLLINPVSSLTLLSSKIIVYLCVCLLQFLMMLLVGKYLFPLIGLESLVVNGSYFLLFLVAIFVGLAAIAYGILLGTIATTSEQSAPFGATSVVVLAAIGGVWIPVFAMPKFMQIIAKISPMNWGLNGFYDVILRDAKFIDILPEISLLGLFFIVLLSISIYIDKLKNAI